MTGESAAPVWASHARQLSPWLAIPMTSTGPAACSTLTTLRSSSSGSCSTQPGDGIMLGVPPTVRDAPFPAVFYDEATCRRRSLIDSSDAHLRPFRKAKMNVARILYIAGHGNENSSFRSP